MSIKNIRYTYICNKESATRLLNEPIWVKVYNYKLGVNEKIN